MPVGGSYSSAVDTSAPPTTRTRPFASGVAVRLARAVDMLAVAVQLPAAVVTDACCDVTDRAPSPSVPEPSAGTASVKTAQIADATDLMRMGEAPSRHDERPEDTARDLAPGLQDP